jgi:hypothetical protein
MANRFLISVAAAALIAGTGFANAQGTGMGREAPSTGAATQQSAPSERAAPSAAPMNRDSASESKGLESKGGDHGMKSTQSEEKPPQGAKGQRAQDDMKAGTKGEKSAQDNNMKGEKSKSMSSENDAKGGSKDMKAEGREDRSGMKAEGREDRGGVKAEGREGRDRMNAQTQGTDRPGTDSKSTTTTGQAGASAKLSTEQRTKITTVIKEQRVAPVNNVNFSISVGTKVPRAGVSFHPLPASVVTIYPEWRGYEFILVRDQIVVIDPRTLEIVAILDA